MGREDFEGLQQGQFWRANRFRTDYEDFNEEGGRGSDSVPYGMIEDGRPTTDENHVWYMSNYATGGDYTGGGLVAHANYDVLLEEAERLSEEMNDESWFQTFYGSHGSFGIAFHVDKTPEEIVEMLQGLEGYALIDEQKHSELEIEAEEKSWEQSYERDYRKALEDKFGGDADSVDDAVLREHFEEARERANVYWKNEEGDNMYVDIDRVMKAVDEPPDGMEILKFFRIEYYRTDEDDATHTEEWFVQADSDVVARNRFIDMVRTGDEAIWDTQLPMEGRPEDSGDDTWYVTVDNTEMMPPDISQKDAEEWESTIVMIKVGKATEVDEEDVDLDRLTEEE